MLAQLAALDGAILLWVQDVLRVGVLDPVAAFYTQLGNAGLLWIVLSVLMLIWPKTRKAGFLGLLALLAGFLCTNVILKHLVSRTRPWLVVPGLTCLVV